MKIISLDTIPETKAHNTAKKKVFIAKGELPNLMQFAQAEIAPGEVMPEHKHADMTEVFLVESGNGTFKVNGETYEIQKGTCVSVSPNELHELTNTGTDVLILTYFALLTNE